MKFKEWHRSEGVMRGLRGGKSVPVIYVKTTTAHVAGGT